MTTYTQLQTDIINEFWDESAELQAHLPALIRRAEDRLADELVTNQFETNTSTVTSVGVNTLSIPSDLRTLRYVRLVRSDGSKKFLQRHTTEYIMDYDYGTTGEPKYYADFSPSQYILSPTPDALYTVEIGYRRKLPALTEANPRNWYTEEAYHLLSYAAFLETAAYLKSDVEFEKYTNLFKRAAERVNNRSRTDDRDDVRVSQRKITQENVEGQ